MPEMQQSGSMLKVPVLWRGNKYVVEMNSCSSLKELGDELQRSTDVKAETMRLIVPQLSKKWSKLLSPFSDEHSCLSLQEALIIEGKSIRMMGVSKDEVDGILQIAKTDLRIAGFDEEERRLRQKMSYGPHSSPKLPEGPYIFCDFRTLQIPGIQLNPPASEALKRMHMLAADPGIVAIMTKHRWRIGIMTEMAPVGYVGVSPKCLLGFNRNQGEEISLRLRTDDLRGFRKYESIKKTLLHELAHMVYSEHDENFYALDKQLNQEAASLDWTKSRGRMLSGVRHSENYEDDYFYEGTKISSLKLGGNREDQLASARASSVAAAYRRLANDFGNYVGTSGVTVEADHDNSGSDICDESNHIKSMRDQHIENLEKSHEPDPDDHFCNQIKFEPNPDDSEHGGCLEPDPDDSHCSGILEPDPDDSGALRNSSDIYRPGHHSEATKMPDGLVLPCDEPDPGEKVVELKNLLLANKTRSGGHSMMIETVKDQTHSLREPDCDECRANGFVQAEPDPDDSMVDRQGLSSMGIIEPDPDDEEIQRIQNSVTAACSRLQRAIGVLQAEVNPTEATTVLQTLFKIIRNIIEHPDEMRFKRLRKANPVIQRNIVNYKAAMEILFLVGFVEDVVLDEIGKAETYLVLKRNDPGLLWLAKSSLESIAN